MTFETSVVVTTYRWPAALHAVLGGLARQRETGFEVVVADDGSGPETAEVVAGAERRWFPGRIKHVWQEDDGFRVARARNLAVQASSGSTLVFLDGDCVPRPDFVASHAGARPGRVTCGRRSLLSEAATAAWLAGPDDAPVPSLRAQIGMRRRGDLNRLPGLTDAPLAILGWPLGWKRFRGMNNAMHRADFMEIDGYDQSFEGWGFEDSDLAIRLQNHGVRLIRPGRGSTVVHLWHREADRRFEGDNLTRLDSVRTSGRRRAVEGLSSLPTP